MIKTKQFRSKVLGQGTKTTNKIQPPTKMKGLCPKPQPIIKPKINPKLAPTNRKIGNKWFRSNDICQETKTTNTQPQSIKIWGPNGLDLSIFVKRRKQPTTNQPQPIRKKGCLKPKPTMKPPPNSDQTKSQSQPKTTQNQTKLKICHPQTKAHQDLVKTK